MLPGFVTDNVFMVFYSLLKFFLILILFTSVLWMIKLIYEVACLWSFSWRSSDLNLEPFFLILRNAIID